MVAEISLHSYSLNQHKDTGGRNKDNQEPCTVCGWLKLPGQDYNYITHFFHFILHPLDDSLPQLLQVSTIMQQLLNQLTPVWEVWREWPYTGFERTYSTRYIASFPGLHAQLLSLAVQKLGVEAWERGYPLQRLQTHTHQTHKHTNTQTHTHNEY